MKNEIIANSCRVCLTKTKKLRSLYKPIDEGDEPPNRMLHLITGIEVEKIDEYLTLPKNICKNCELSLSMAFEFRVNALRTQQIIMEYLREFNKNDFSEETHSQNNRSNVKNEYEEIMDLEPLDCPDTLDEDITEYSLENLNDEHKSLLDSNDILNEEEEVVEQEHTSYLVENHEDSEIENYSDHHQHNEDELQDEDEQSQRITDHQEKEDESEGQLEKIIICEDQNYTTVCQKMSSKNSYKVNGKKDNHLEERIEKNELENMKQIVRRGRKPANTNNQVGYICDICGNIFAKRGRMTEHRQRHDKELKYNCEVCDEKFHTRELLRKHMFSHRGGKPLKCEYCSRTFYYESVRKAHEAIHKGHRPYVCNICGKAFGYAHALKKHKLIHAEIKLYRCLYCNKDFRLQHHMKQHELTKLHQNAVRFANYGNTNIEDCGGETNTNAIIEGGQNINDDILFIEEIAEDQLTSGS